MIIDTHQHLLYPKEFNYEWAADLPALQGEFNLQDYWSQAGGSAIAGTIFMEVDVPESEQGKEARFFCALAEDPQNKILGVIASARPENEGFETYLDSIAHPKLKGIRRVFHTLPGDLAIDQTFIKNIQLLGERGLTFDICALPHQLSLLLPLLRACPNTKFILDHCGIPPIASGEFNDWRERIAQVAGEPNVFCKVSGMVAYCQAGSVSAETLRPWFDAVVELFGHQRLIFGGDWPVCNLTSSLSQWLRIAEELTVDFNEVQKHAFWSENATKFYGV